MGCLKIVISLAVLCAALAAAYFRGLSAGANLGSTGMRELSFWRELGQSPDRVADCPELTGDILRRAQVCAVVCNATYVEDSPAAALVPFPTSGGVASLPEAEKVSRRVADHVESRAARRGEKKKTKIEAENDDDDGALAGSGLSPAVITAVKRGRAEMEAMMAPYGTFRVIGGALADPSVVRRSITDKAWSWLGRLISWTVGLSHPWVGFILSLSQRLDLWWLDNAFDVVPTLLAVEESNGDLYVFVRGSITMAEWIHDGNATLVDGAHAGYQHMSAALWPQLEPQIAAILDARANIGSIIVTGHSLGAGVATILADEISRSFGSRLPIKLYTYGSPRVFSAARAARFAKRGVHAERFVALHDPVTQFPVSALKDFDSEPAGEQAERGLVYEHVGQGFEIGKYPPAKGSYGCIGNVANMPPDQLSLENHHLVLYIKVLNSIKK